MLIAGLIAFVFGLLQFVCNILLFPAVFGGRWLRTGLLILAKLVFYAAGISLLLTWFRALVRGAAIGFGAGFLLCIIAYGICKIGYKGGMRT